MIKAYDMNNSNKLVPESVVDTLEVVSNTDWNFQNSKVDLDIPKFTPKEHVRMVELNREYNKKLVSLGLAKSRSAIKDLDRIDVRSMLDIGLNDLSTGDIPIDAIQSVQDQHVELGINTWREQVGVYSTIPCFSEGVLLIAKNRYIYWNIKSVDILDDEVSAKIFLKEYVGFDDLWVCSTEGVAEFVGLGYREDSDVKYLADIESDIPTSEFTWSKDDIRLWNKLIQFNRQLTERLKNFDTTTFEEVVKIFIKLITIVNFKLSQEKPVADRKANKKINRVEYVESMQPKRLVRNISGITFTSVKPPKSSSRETVIHYKVASWKARGGFRHLKDGRIVPFKESIRHRKCLTPTDNVPTSIITVK